MSTKFEQVVPRIWDNAMPEIRWSRWNSADKEDNEDIMRFATEIARTAFDAGSAWATLNEEWDSYDIKHELNKRYPFPKVTKYRTSAPDSNGNRWQVRGGITWLSRDYAEFHPHVAVKEVIAAMSNLNKYDDVALLADIAANPTED